MRNHLFNVGLVAVAAVTAVAMYPSMVRRLSVDGIHIPKVLKALTTFSDAPSFVKTSPRVFRYKGGKKSRTCDCRFQAAITRTCNSS